MAGLTFTGIAPTIVNPTNTVGGNRAGMFATGTTRWNQTDSTFEVFDGYQWVTMGNSKNETLQDIVQHAEDRVATAIVEEHKDNTTIQDAFKTWEEANKRFMVVLALAEK